MSDWIDVNDKLPENDGLYLVIIGLFKKCITVARYGHNLYKVSKYDFRKGDSGFYNFDGELGYYKEKDVLAWMELPEIPEKYLKKE